MMAPMLNPPEPACLVIADISGYTGYLEPEIPMSDGRFLVAPVEPMGVRSS